MVQATLHRFPVKAPLEHKKTIDVPATTREVIERVSCDLCGTRTDAQDVVNVDDVTVKRELGVCYPEGSRIETAEVDMCGKCFEEKLVPWLEEHGARIRYGEIDY